MTSRPTVLASIVLALALLGDSLLYAVLPLHAATFGVSLAWAGVLLSANRIVRLFAYPILPRLARTGLRRFTIAAAACGAISTLAFAAGSGGWTLLASRLVWGVAFGSLSLSTLAYATEWNDAAGKRVGLSLALRELGPLSSLTLGTAAVAMAGVRPTLAALGMMSMAGVGLAMRLPDLAMASDVKGPKTRRPPPLEDWLSLTAGAVMDGIFPATIGLLIASSSGTGEAVIGAGLLLGFKRVAVVILAPVSGHASDRFGERTVTAAGFAIVALGAFIIAFGGVIAGALLLGCGAAVTTTTIPIAAAIRDPEERVAALARTAMARDAGAAAGPLAALAFFDAAGAAAVYAVAGTVLAVIAVWLAGFADVMQRTTARRTG
jgi:MFS transporter, DHA1 family, inner membrane transport protein